MALHTGFIYRICSVIWKNKILYFLGYNPEYKNISDVEVPIYYSKNQVEFYKQHSERIEWYIRISVLPLKTGSTDELVLSVS